MCFSFPFLFSINYYYNSGCKIKALRAKTNTYIKTPVRGEEPVFIVTGRKEDVTAAKREILAAADHFTQIRASRRANANAGLITGSGPSSVGGHSGSGSSSDHVTIQVRVPYRVVGLVVGPKGATIKNIQQTTHTYIVTPSRDKEPIFEITGSRDNVEKAREKIETHIKSRTGNGLAESDVQIISGGSGSDTASLLSSSTGSLAKGLAGDGHLSESLLNCLQNGDDYGSSGHYSSSNGSYHSGQFPKSVLADNGFGNTNTYGNYPSNSPRSGGNGGNSYDDGLQSGTYSSSSSMWGNSNGLGVPTGQGLLAGGENAFYQHRSNSLGGAPNGLRFQNDISTEGNQNSGPMGARRFVSDPFHLANGAPSVNGIDGAMIFANNGFSPIPATVQGMLENALEATPQKPNGQLPNGKLNGAPTVPISAILKRSPAAPCAICMSSDFDPVLDPLVPLVLNCNHSIAVCRDCHTTTEPGEVRCPRCHHLAPGVGNAANLNSVQHQQLAV